MEVELLEIVRQQSKKLKKQEYELQVTKNKLELVEKELNIRSMFFFRRKI